MNRDDLIRMAREAGLALVYSERDEDGWRELERFAELIVAEQERILLAAYQVAMYQVAAEREACAKIVEQYCGAWDDAGYALSQAIRARRQE